MLQIEREPMLYSFGLEHRIVSLIVKLSLKVHFLGDFVCLRGIASFPNLIQLGSSNLRELSHRLSTISLGWKVTRHLNDRLFLPSFWSDSRIVSAKFRRVLFLKLETEPLLRWCQPIKFHELQNCRTVIHPLKKSTNS